MKKIASFSVLTAVALSAQILPSNVLETSSLAQENGGSKSAIEAYSDGGGSIVIGNNSDAVKPIDNSPMNTLVFKYGQEAKANSANIVDQVKVLSASASVDDKALADKIDVSAMTPKDGTACDDGNTQTINDVYTNGVCAGVQFVGTLVDVRNINFIDETSYSNTNYSISKLFKLTAIDVNNENPYLYTNYATNKEYVVNFNKLTRIGDLKTSASHSNPSAYPTYPFSIYSYENGIWVLKYESLIARSVYFTHNMDFVTTKIKIKVNGGFFFVHPENFWYIYQ